MMINANDYSTHEKYSGISAKDEGCVADMIFRATGVPLAKNSNKTGIDLFSLDTDRLLAVEVEGANPGTWPSEDPYPKYWDNASFVFKKLRNFIICESLKVPSIYVKINHFQSQAYYTDGRSLLSCLCQGHFEERENRNKSLNDGRFLWLDWADDRLKTGMDGFRDFTWGLLSKYGYRKTKDPNRAHYMSPGDASRHYGSRLRTPVAIDIGKGSVDATMSRFALLTDGCEWRV